ncbi:MAG: hypothetical protein GX552_09495 [Chloroflexi bacterium]|nr:hypothetical protein [Chloroflexota bacterium]
MGIKARSDHRFAAENLSAYLDGRLTVLEKDRLERHLTTCSDCRQELSTLRATVALLRQAPMRPVPRSFTLPLSVQGEQAQHRRWNMTHSFMRVATVVVSLLLVIVVSGDVLLGQGVLGIPDAYKLAGAQEKRFEAIEEPTASAELLQAAPAQESTADQAAPASEAAPDVQAAPEAQAELELESIQAPEESAPSVDAEKAEKEVTGGGEPGVAQAAPGATGEQDGTPEGEEANRGVAIPGRMGTMPASEATPEESPDVAVAAQPEATAVPEREVSPEEPVALAQAAPEDQAAPDVQAAPESFNSQEAFEGEQAPEAYGETEMQAAPDIQAAPEVQALADSATERGAEAPVATGLGLSPMWTAWQMLRLIALMLGGLLLVLIGGLLWSGHKRQI